jgi:hypothetical protein
LPLGRSGEPERDRSADDLLGVDDLRAADARPFCEDLTHRHVLRLERHEAVFDVKAHVLRLGARDDEEKRHQGDEQSIDLHGITWDG